MKTNTRRDAIIMDLLFIEGGYVDHADDSGGKTKYGITEYVAKRHRYDVHKISKDQAIAIYVADYWDKLRLDDVLKRSEKLAIELFDTGINMGIARSAEFLQRSLNVLNKKGKLYPDLKVDGAIGNKTLSALDKYLSKRKQAGADILFKMLNTLQGAFYFSLAERRQKDESFIYGWFGNRIS